MEPPALRRRRAGPNMIARYAGGFTSQVCGLQRILGRPSRHQTG